ncbi:uncharacterized protein LOC106094566 [Stomoxys calcitrans]|uniref:uncharacterized protein LOC106094566 n=1 Tax=Stomoxys calcitrans TaxID=35570 RepID=UPI0027E37E5E|nr:uncharacterized protein LOC106094566 [Stomoxys calcitrans]
MARGRNHNRNRHQHLQSAQKQQAFPQTPQQQLQQQLHQHQKQHLFNQEQQEQHPQIFSCHNPPMQSTNATDAPVAAINEDSGSGSGSTNGDDVNQNFDQYPQTPSKISESYGHNNKSNDDYGHDDANPIINGPLAAGGGLAIKSHLETSGDPANASAAAAAFTTTHTYQMTMSNNSPTDFSQVNSNYANHNSHSLPAQRAETPEKVNSNSAKVQSQEKLANFALHGESRYEPSLQQREEYGGVQQLSNGECEQPHYINRSPVIEQNVSAAIAQVTDHNEQENKRIADDGDGQLNEATTKTTVCESNRVLIINQSYPTSTTTTTTADSPAMGQKNTKGGEAAASTPSSSTTNVREFRESPLPPRAASAQTNNNHIAASNGSTNGAGRYQSPPLPTITVSDCSANSRAPAPQRPNEKEEVYDCDYENVPRNFTGHGKGQEEEYFETASTPPPPLPPRSTTPTSSSMPSSPKVNATSPSPPSPSSPSSYRSPSPTSVYSQMRYNYAKLEDVPEQEEEEYEDDDEDDEEDDDDEDEEVVTDDDDDEGNVSDEGPLPPQRTQASAQAAAALASRYGSPGNLDNEFRRLNSASLSPDRQRHAKNFDISNNSTESNLSSSFPDSGMGESVASTNSRFINNNTAQGEVRYNSSATANTTNMPQGQQPNNSMKQQQHQQMHFVRDGSSTDCEETLMQCEDFIDFVETPEFLDPSERFVCIESISLPDVVVESTNSCSNSSGNGANSGNSSDAASSGAADRDIININGATGNSMGNVHFIPIHVEGASSSDRSSPRKQCVDDSVVGSGKATIEIIEDVTEFPTFSTASSRQSDFEAEKMKKELLEQKTQFSEQLEDAHKNVNQLQTKINEMQMKIETLEQELSTKTWNVERLQGELKAAQRDDEYVRQKLKVVEDEKTNLRHRYSECEDELKMKYDELEVQYNELQEKYNQTQALARNLQTQLAQAQTEAEEWREQVDKIRTSLEEQISLLKSALENSENERKICQDKWQREFEMLRTQNMDREESIMTDCEWQLRETQKQCKERIERVEEARKEAVANVDLLENELEALSREIDDMKIYQSQVNSLRGVVNEQANSIETLMAQIESLKQELATANENLEEQIEAVTKIKYHCDNAIYDKERETINRIDEVRNEAAAFWEDKLYTEMTRLKNELESVYVEERRDALDKLQMEHVEELKALTNRYTYNEEELRAELTETQESLERKSQEFLELREKSDTALLQTRMHLDRADREFQKAMCQEEERREALELKLRKDFEEEKLEMEEKFRERLGQVKEEFARELQINTQELTKEHRKEVQKIQAKLTAEKDQALQELAERHRLQMVDVEERIKDVELRYKRDLKDLKAAYDAEKLALDKRDISNANEIEQLHRKCRCLTNLFEEMRMRYERRDPRPEDLREIAELRERCESQERDMYLLTDRLCELQTQMDQMQQNQVNNNTTKKAKQIKKPPPKTIPTNCDVIYEENEERESPPPTPNSYAPDTINEEDDADDINRTDDSKNQKIVDFSKSKSKLITNNQQDDSHMITAM